MKGYGCGTEACSDSRYIAVDRESLDPCESAGERRVSFAICHIYVKVECRPGYRAGKLYVIYIIRAVGVDNGI